MRRRRHLDAWPAVADLMTVLAVLGLFTALAVVPASEPLELLDRIHRQDEQIAAKTEELRQLRAQVALAETRHAEAREECEGRLNEVVRNERMFHAIQRVQEIVDQISADQQLEFSDDQTLVFGEDLVEYEVNSTVPIFRPRARERLLRFCSALRDATSSADPNAVALRTIFTVEVRGHADDLACPGDPHCNWWVSASRAAHFVALMQQDEFCPSGHALAFKAVGLANAGAPTERAERRIEVMLVPNYHSWVSDE